MHVKFFVYFSKKEKSTNYWEGKCYYKFEKIKSSKEIQISASINYNL